MTAQAISVRNFTLSFPDATKDDLGLFTGLSGLSLAMEVDELYEGGGNEFPHYLNTRIRYKPLVVSRLVTELTSTTCKWVLDNMTNPKPRTGEVAFLDADEQEIARIEFLSLQPVAWRGPTLDMNASRVAFEEIEFVHGGFSFKPPSPR